MNKKQYLGLLLLIILIIGGAFYWFQYRPTKIKHDCSWVKKHSDFVPGISENQANEDNANCLKEAQKSKGKFWYDLNIAACDKKPTSDKPAKDWWEPASTSEYTFCIHEKGL